MKILHILKQLLHILKVGGDEKGHVPKYVLLILFI